MSQNFRASYTETLGKLETQYCKLMVSVRRVRFERCPLLQGVPGPSWPQGRASLLCWGSPRALSQSSCPGRFVLLRKPRASDCDTCRACMGLCLGPLLS